MAIKTTTPYGTFKTKEALRKHIISNHYEAFIEAFPRLDKKVTKNKPWKDWMTCYGNGTNTAENHQVHWILDELLDKVTGWRII